jgi:hypothetical protein
VQPVFLGDPHTVFLSESQKDYHFLSRLLQVTLRAINHGASGLVPQHGSWRNALLAIAYKQASNTHEAHTLRALDPIQRKKNVFVGWMLT